MSHISLVAALRMQQALSSISAGTGGVAAYMCAADVV